MHPATKLMLAATLLVLGGCASKTVSRMGSAAAAPLKDLGISKEEIPAVLEKAKDNPYRMPAGRSCAAIAREIRELDEALGPDYDAPAVETKESLADKASDVAEDQAVGAVQRTAEGLIPFRSWVRKLSGAERHSKHVAASLTAGSVRRAFLKGLASSQHCAWQEKQQAAPKPP
ncbi:hypothetical protein ACI48D_00545 [Massilia sp. LXY-6]|uniref:hypothetical protein n=1 Tax=Massilia sp. LXY-6 TaxID=3379823 RepID=UPI003EE335E7